MKNAEAVLDAATLVVAMLAVVLAGAILRTRLSGNDRGMETRRIAAWHSVASEGRRIGPEDAPVVLVEFGDYECPACRSFHKHLEAAGRMFGDSLAIVWRHFPLESHPKGEVAAVAAECAAHQGRFWPYHNALFHDSRWLGLGGDVLEHYAVEAEVPDMVAFRECLYSPANVPRIERDLIAARELEVTGTPTLIINGLMLKGSVDSLQLAELIRDGAKIRR